MQYVVTTLAELIAHTHTYSLILDSTYGCGNGHIVELSDWMTCDDIQRTVSLLRVADVLKRTGLIAWLCLWDRHSGVRPFVVWWAFWYFGHLCSPLLGWPPHLSVGEHLRWNLPFLCYFLQPSARHEAANIPLNCPPSRRGAPSGDCGWLNDSNNQ